MIASPKSTQSWKSHTHQACMCPHAQPKKAAPHTPASILADVITTTSALADVIITMSLSIHLLTSPAMSANVIIADR